jgi:hypothetical protein
MKARQKLFNNAKGALVRLPIEDQALKERGSVPPEEGSFTLRLKESNLNLGDNLRCSFLSANIALTD